MRYRHGALSTNVLDSRIFSWLDKSLEWLTSLWAPSPTLLQALRQLRHQFFRGKMSVEQHHRSSALQHTSYSLFWFLNFTSWWIQEKHITCVKLTKVDMVAGQTLAVSPSTFHSSQATWTVRLNYLNAATLLLIFFLFFPYQAKQRTIWQRSI